MIEAISFGLLLGSIIYFLKNYEFKDEITSKFQVIISMFLISFLISLFIAYLFPSKPSYYYVNSSSQLAENTLIPLGFIFSLVSQIFLFNNVRKYNKKTSKKYTDSQLRLFIFSAFLFVLIWFLILFKFF
jgi:H+/Cl- antiporter ClcA